MAQIKKITNSSGVLITIRKYMKEIRFVPDANLLIKIKVLPTTSMKGRFELALNY